MLLVTALLAIQTQYQPALIKDAVREAVAAVLDSAAQWTPMNVGAARHVVIDRVSFQAKAATAALGRDENWSDFATSVRGGAEDKKLDDVKICSSAKRCTLPAATVVVSAVDVRMKGRDVQLVLAVSWPSRTVTGLVEYVVTIRNGRVVAIKQGAATATS